MLSCNLHPSSKITKLPSSLKMNASSLLGRLGGEDDARRTRNKRVMKGLARGQCVC